MGESEERRLRDPGPSLEHDPEAAQPGVDAGGRKRVDAYAILRSGCGLLAVVLEPAGFRYEHVDSGRSSGGDFAVGRWSKDHRAIDLHVRSALGVVQYRLGDVTLDHRDYMERLGVTDPEYPGFSQEPLDAFLHLRADLMNHCGVFFDGSGDEQFRDWAVRPIRRARFLP